MHAWNDSVAPARICASASFSEVGDFARIVAAVALANSASARSASSAARIVLDPVALEQPVDGAATRRELALARRLGEGRERRIDRDRAAQRVGQIGQSATTPPDGWRCVAATPSAALSRSPVSAQ